MTVRRSTAIVTAALACAAPLAVAAPAAAHGSMTDPVSRVAACYAEGPEAPKSAACKAAVKASGTQAFYDWNEVNIANAAGHHKALIPDGKLCSAGRPKYRGLDLARADWPASRMAAGKHTFRYRATAPHRGSFALYITKAGYDPRKPLKWSDLESKPFAKVTDPALSGGSYVFTGKVPQRSGRHLIYSIWQRSDSPEAFYTCSDVVFRRTTQGGGSGTGGTGSTSGGTGSTSGGTASTSGGTGGTAPGPVASAPSDRQIRDGAARSTVNHSGHAGHAGHGTAGTAGTGTGTGAGSETEAKAETGTLAGGLRPAGSATDLAETGASSRTPLLAVGGAGALAVGAALLFATVRRRSVSGGGRHAG
ncbi:lytic polysaccharide monooxygenase [Streptomyces sp. NRRL S-87]|uniref:lytic polysaccharide monooxygenase auxiliary activity family 9 protein n=1 Tax=Streptomyces sp. NRRL S-87 TaxID=1463920 RepID=UPI0004C0CE1A|nr:lytic polysaccharide monooxygenase [Streptomyces sp. NRRL S-87]